jgi:putative lipoprotein
VRTRASIVLFFVASMLAANEARAADPDPDPWFGHDKVLHFSASLAIAGTGYGITAAFTETRGIRLLVGGGVSLAAGAGKELYDLSGHGDPSWRDFTWDVIGTVVGLAIAYGIDVAFVGVDAKHPALAAPPSAAARGFVIRF